MASVFTSDFIQARITALKAAYVACETAMGGLEAGTLQSYTLDTGQTRQTITKKNLAVLQNHMDWLLGRLQYWDGLLNNTGTVLARSLS
jgi:hypothetical protein